MEGVSHSTARLESRTSGVGSTGMGKGGWLLLLSLGGGSVSELKLTHFGHRFTPVT